MRSSLRDLTTALCVLAFVMTAGSMPAAQAAPAAQSAETIVDLVAGDDELATLRGLLMAAGQISTLGSEGPYTLFAPSQAAFAALSEAEFEALLVDPEGALAQTLQFHIVPGRLSAADLVDGLEMENLAGAPLDVAVDGDTIQINGTPVVRRDIVAANGVIHVVDSLLTTSEAPAAVAEASSEETATDETATDETATDETAADETAADDTAADETAADETAADETAADEAPTEAAAAESTATEEATPEATVAEEVAVAAPAATAEAPVAQSSDEDGGLPWWLWLLLALLVFGLLYWFFARRKAAEAPEQPDLTSQPDSVEAAVRAVTPEPVKAEVDTVADDTVADDTDADSRTDDVAVDQTEPVEPGPASVALAAVAASEDPTADETLVASSAGEEASADERPVDETDEAEAGVAGASAQDTAIMPAVTAETADASAEDADLSPAAKATGAVAAADAASLAGPAAPDEPSDPDVWDPGNHPDDLTQILGIGRVYEERLYAAGIATWDQVAATSVAKLEQATQAVAGANAAGWPRQAQELATANDRVGAQYVGPTPQRLSLIPGIGEETEQALYQQGITTYARLAALSPAQLAELLPEASSMQISHAGLR